jgi:AraC family transcriptional regulator of arabinose operon
MSVREITPHARVETLFTGHFRVGPGYSAWRPQGTDDWLLIYTVAGRGRFGGADGKTHYGHPGDLMLLRPGTLHDYGVESQLQQWELLWTHFRPRPDWLDLIDWPAHAPGLHGFSVTSAGSRHQLAQQFERTHHAALGSDPLRDRIAMNALECLLLLCHQLNPQWTIHAGDSRVREAMDYVAKHLGEKITLDDLAEVSGLSVSRLGHRFREVAGVAPMEFVERMRLDRAKQLLTMTSLSVKEISRQVGYDTQFYFSLRFKKHTGQSPSAFRRVPRLGTPNRGTHAWECGLRRSST